MTTALLWIRIKSGMTMNERLPPGGQAARVNQPAAPRLAAIAARIGFA